MSDLFASLCEVTTQDTLRFLSSPHCGAEERNFPSSYEELEEFLRRYHVSEEAFNPPLRGISDGYAVLTTDERNRIPGMEGQGLLLLRPVKRTEQVEVSDEDHRKA